MTLKAKAFGLVISLLVVGDVSMKSTSNVFRELEDLEEVLELLEEKREQDNTLNGDEIQEEERMSSHPTYVLATDAISRAKDQLEEEYIKRHYYYDNGYDLKPGTSSGSTMEALNDLSYHSHGAHEENKTLIALFAEAILIRENSAIFPNIDALSRNGKVKQAFRDEEGTEKCNGYNNPISYVSCEGQKDSPYRRIDGTCNNLENELWGSKDAVQIRLIPAQYADGIGSPRNESVKTVKGVHLPLPNPRTISATILRNDSLGNATDTPDDLYRTMMMTVWGQFLDHDITETPMTKGLYDTSVACCTLPEAERRLRPRPNQCVDFVVEDGDYHFGNTKPCMDVIRSLPARKNPCLPGIREQINGITTFIDASQVYGSDDATANDIRSFTDGKMKVGNQNLLPPNPDTGACVKTTLYGAHCQYAGDIRVNENPHLAAIHIVFVRFHNRLADQFKEKDSSLSDEDIYQLCRKIIGAIMQHVTYTKWLPAVLGDKLMRKYKLEIGVGHQYNDRTNPSTQNHFSSATMRYGHTLVHNLIILLNDCFRTHGDPLANNFFIVDKLFNSAKLGDMARWMVTLPCKQSDAFFADSIQNQLFGKMLDLPAINIQRAREHGIPSYTEYRSLCKLSDVSTFDNLTDHTPYFRNKFREVYDDVKDIDLFVGGVSEISVKGGHVGPTFGCLLGKQFEDIKEGDRYWFERSTIEGFTQGQREAILKFDLANVFCHGLGLKEIQQDIFVIPRLADLKPCSHYADFDVSEFLNPNIHT
ncbi:myeloperoxidase-like [Argopecten irradians]|uniref:myeloperoxidase-like n=1 Tax=Argopecten irradians TaxID=31199 RepID=UPI0037156F81